MLSPLVAIALGLTALIGWIFDLATLKSGVPGQPPMKLNVTVALILAGISLWASCTASPHRYSLIVAKACAGAVLLISLATLGEYLTGMSFGIDQLWLQDTVNFPGDIPGRMPVRIALCLTMLATALWLLDRDYQVFAETIQALALASVLIAASGLAGYIYNSQNAPLVRQFISPMAANAAAIIVLLGIGITLARAEFTVRHALASDSLAGSTVRRLLPAAIGLPLVTGWLLVQGRHAGYLGEHLEMALLTVVTIAGLSIVILWNARALIDIDTRRKRAEEEIHRLNEELRMRIVQLKASTREIESFAYSVSHDLRSPLRAIDGFSSILLEEHRDQLNDEGRRLLGVVCDNTRKMAQLIDDILHFSRVGRIEIVQSMIDMEALAREIFSELQPATQGRRIDFEIGALPPARGDRHMIRQVLVNLIANAIKFTRGRDNAQITLSATVAGNECIYSLRDNGAGFDMQYASKLFGVFQRLHGVDEFEGTGIGLAIVKRVITRHGGRVWAEGKINDGAAIYFALPLMETVHD